MPGWLAPHFYLDVPVRILDVRNCKEKGSLISDSGVGWALPSCPVGVSHRGPREGPPLGEALPPPGERNRSNPDLRPLFGGAPSLGVREPILFLTLLRIPLPDLSFSGGKLAVSPSALVAASRSLGGRGGGMVAALAVTSDGASSINAPGGLV
jgi:hypothetical protein